MCLKLRSLFPMPNTKQPDISQLIAALNFIHPVSDAVKNYLAAHVRPMQIKKGKYLLKSGEISNEFYFINKGVIRGFIKIDQREITTWITAENELVTSISSFDLQSPARENIQAIENCDLLIMTHDALQNLYDTIPEFNITGRKLLTIYYRQAEERALISRLMKASSKYQYFLTMHENLANRIPLKYIASYIGINLETLSRVRKKKATGAKN